MFEKETIAAIATGLTESGVGIIRISGDKSVEIGDSLFRSPSGKRILGTAESHRLYYGYIVDGTTENSDWKNHVIDEVMIFVLKAPKSYTGEDTVEIQCHGGVLVMKRILEAALKAGARLSEPGEFTKRAFLNGRIDLTKAEAVMDLIHSQNEYALTSSVSQLQGNLYQKIQDFREKILYEIAFIESALDDPEHISLDGYSERILRILSEVSGEIMKLISSFDNGRIIREGISTVIVGKPNAGKSSLLNLFVGEERAIVTDIAGTTRDIIRETVKLGDISLNIVDTAGIRETNDLVERIGVDKAIKCAEDADLVLYVVDSSVPLDRNDTSIISILKSKKTVILLNKTDLCTVVSKEDMEAFLHENKINNDKCVILHFSAKNSFGIEELTSVVTEMFFRGDIKINDEIMITNTRHKEALTEAYQSLLLVRKSVEDEMPEDFYSIDLMNAYASLGRIIGEQVDDDLVEEIFSKFCMGK